jgi:hypothetical protein
MDTMVDYGLPKENIPVCLSTIFEEVLELSTRVIQYLQYRQTGLIEMSGLQKTGLQQRILQFQKNRAGRARNCCCTRKKNTRKNKLK